MRTNNTTINILGTEYKVIFGVTKDMKDKDIAGLCKVYDKVITIPILDDFYDCDTEKGKEYGVNKTIIHELTHAYIEESQVKVHVLDEEALCDWNGVMIPKIMENFNYLVKERDKCQ